MWSNIIAKIVTAIAVKVGTIIFKAVIDLVEDWKDDREIEEAIREVDRQESARRISDVISHK